MGALLYKEGSAPDVKTTKRSTRRSRRRKETKTKRKRQMVPVMGSALAREGEQEEEVHEPKYFDVVEDAGTVTEKDAEGHTVRKSRRLAGKYKKTYSSSK